MLFEEYFDLVQAVDDHEILKRLLSLIPATGDIVEIGSASGRVLRWFLENSNRKIVGIEISELFVALSTFRLQKYINSGQLDLIQGNILEVSLPKECSLVTILSNTLSMILLLEQRKQVLKKIHENLVENGILTILNVGFSDFSSYTPKREIKLSNNDNLYTNTIITENREEQTRYINFSVKNSIMEESLLFKTAIICSKELEVLLKEIGFKKIEKFSGLKHEPFNPDSYLYVINAYK